MRIALAALVALALLSITPSAQAQYCWDTVCAAGTPAADCWRAWCVDGWSSPAYPYRAAGWYRADAPSPSPYPQPYTPTYPTPAWLRTLSPLTPAQGCSTGRVVDWVVWGC